MDEGKNETAAWRDPNDEIYPIFTRGQNPNVYIKGEDGEYERGKVWPYYPGIYADDLIQCDDCDEWNENVGTFHSEVMFFFIITNKPADPWYFRIFGISNRDFQIPIPITGNSGFFDIAQN